MKKLGALPRSEVGSLSVYQQQRRGFVSMKACCWNGNNGLYFHCHRTFSGPH